MRHLGQRKTAELDQRVAQRAVAMQTLGPADQNLQEGVNRKAGESPIRRGKRHLGCTITLKPPGGRNQETAPHITNTTKDAG